MRSVGEQNQNLKTEKMRKTFVVALLAVALVSAYSSVDHAVMFESWKIQHGRSYATPEEHAARFEIFSQNLAKIVKHNDAKKSWTMRVNQFSDLTKEEFVNTLKFRLPNTPRNVVPVEAVQNLLGATSDFRA
jgi:hypothetical protein